MPGTNHFLITFSITAPRQIQYSTLKSRRTTGRHKNEGKDLELFIETSVRCKTRERMPLNLEREQLPGQLLHSTGSCNFDDLPLTEPRDWIGNLDTRQLGLFKATCSEEQDLVQKQ